MSRWMLFFLLAAVVVWNGLKSLGPATADDRTPATERPVAPTEEQLAFFETRIRPVLVEHCYECHSESSKGIKGNLLVDSRQGLLSGGDSGPAVVVGNSAESLLISALKHESFEMPPKGKLPPQVIADFEKWVAMGLPDPRTGEVSVRREGGIDLAQGRQFWAFQPLNVSPPPAVQEQEWPRSDIDRFVLHKLEQQGVAPGKPADGRTLLRRLSYDLTGLPPSPETQREFEGTVTSEQLEQLVDGLLNSPAFGERWGRYWLDSARYSESTGGGRSMLYGPAWRYRDYVIDAFNSDKPFDQFLIEQLAGDLLTSEDVQQRAAQITATAFLALGPTNYELQDKKQLEMDVIDEQIETVGRVFLGMTLACARCHDHKFDPIPTADYYALAGIFKSTHTLTHSNVSNWVTLPLPMDEETSKRIQEHDQKIALLKSRLAEIRSREGELSARLPTITADDDQAVFTGTWTDSTHSQKFLGKQYRHATGDGASATFSIPVKPGKYEVLVSYSAGANRSPAARIALETLSGSKEVQIDQTKAPPVDGLYVRLGEFEFSETAKVSYTTSGVKGVVIVDSVQLRALSTSDVPDQDAAQVTVELAQLAKEAADLEKQIEKLNTSRPQPEKVLAVEEASQIGDEQICIRGNIKQRGAAVPRGFLSVLSWEGQPEVPATSSGRLELGYWLASPQNPLTSRVYVNRVWSHLFGRGLVRTTDNFGKPGELPSHPELLDYLANRFVQEGWSTKKLIRQIVLSRTYQLASDERPELQSMDPDNRWLGRQNRRRLDAEAIYDTLLSVSGELVLGLGGNTMRPETKAEIGYQFDVGRRALYLPVFRNQLHDLMTVFDFADPNQSVGSRNVSTLSTQSLFLMNSPFVVERARQTSRRLGELAIDPAERIERLFEETVSRPPTSSERELILGYLQPAADSPQELEKRWVEVCQSMFGSIDFRYLE